MWTTDQKCCKRVEKGVGGGVGNTHEYDGPFHFRIISLDLRSHENKAPSKYRI